MPFPWWNKKGDYWRGQPLHTCIMNSSGEYLVKHRSSLQWLCSQLQTCRKGQRTSLLTIPQKSCCCRKGMENCASHRNQELTCLNWEKFKFLTFWSCSQLCWCFSLTAPLSNRNRSCLIPSRPQQRDYMCKRHENRAENPRLMLSKKIPSALWVLLAGYSSALVVVSFQWL